MQPHYVSRSASEVDQTCPRRRYWNTVFHGIGLEPSGTSEDLIVGTALHAGPEALWRSGNLETAVQAMKDLPEWPKLGPMWHFWCECILRAYYRVRYLIKVKTWEPMAVEQEVTYSLGPSPSGRPLILLAKPDLMLRHKLLGLVRYVEFKTTRLMDDKFMKSWMKRVQLAAGQLCYEERGITVDQVQVAFWCKGAKTQDGYWRTPFLSAWRTKAGPPMSKGRKPNLKLFSVQELLTESTVNLPTQYSAKRPEKWAGWERFDVWESGMTPVEWVAKLSDKDLEPELPETPEMVFDPILRANWALQIAYREGEIADISTSLAQIEIDRMANVFPPHFSAAHEQQLLNEHFRQNFDKCEPAQGYECPFLALCFNPTIAANPVASGLYKYREPHHAIEARALGVEE